MCIRCLCFTIYLLAACSTHETVESEIDFSIITGGEALYSFLFTAPPPDGTSLKIILNDYRIEDACELYGPDAEKGGNTDFWYMGLELGSTEPGTFSVVTNPEQTDEAGVRFVHVISFKVQAVMRASRGRVVVKNHIDIESRNDLSLFIEAEFPTRQPADFECGSDSTVDGRSMSNICTCWYDDGEKTSCVSNGVENCCIRDDGPRERFEADINAKFCNWMCSITHPDFAQYCYETD